MAIIMTVLFVTSIPIIEVSAQVPQESKDAACAAIGGDCNDGSAPASVSGLLSKVINILSWIVGVISVIMIIVGGLRFIISSGDPNATKAARSTVIYSLVGLVVAASAQLLVRFVLNKTINP